MHNLCQTLLQKSSQAYISGKFDVAIKTLDEIFSINPDYADGLHLRGLIAFAEKQYYIAENWILQAIKNNPNQVYFNSLCVVQTAKGEFDKAVISARNGLSLDYNSPTLFYNLALALQFIGDMNGAAFNYYKTLDLAPNWSIVHNNLGVVLKHLGRFEDAKQYFQHATELDSDNSAAQNNLGNIFMIYGDLENAEIHYRQAIDNDPENFAYYRNLVQCKHLNTTDPHFVAMEKKIKCTRELHPENQAHLHFAFGQALLECGDKERSFEHIQYANNVYRTIIDYNESYTLDLFKNIQTLFTSDIFEQKHNIGDQSKLPVFIIGMPRSGSTLIEQILSSHPFVFGIDERSYFEKALSEDLTERGCSIHTLDPCTLHKIKATSLVKIGGSYMHSVFETVQQAENYQRITDKYLYNFLYLGLIHLALPNAKIIHIRRDPIETCLSIYSKFLSNTPYGYDLGELGRYYRAYADLMAHWRNVLPEGVMIEVQYEKLVDDFEATVRLLLDHCELEWNERCKTFYQTKRYVLTASARQVREPLFRTSLRKWRPCGSLLQALFDALGDAT